MLKKSKSVYLLAIVTAIVLLAPGPVQLVSPAFAEHCEKNHKKDSGCGGNNDPGAETPVSADFVCPNEDLSGGRICSTTSMVSHRIQGDGPGATYEDGLDDVTAHIRESGILQLRTDAKGGKPGKRNIYWDFRQGLGNGLTLNSGDALTTTDDLPIGYGHASVIQVGRGAIGVDFRKLVVGVPPTSTNLWADLMIKPNKGSKQFFFIRFEDPTKGDQCPGDSDATTVTVKRLDTAMWQIVGDKNATACIQGTGLDFVLGPFSFIVEEMP